MESKTKLCYVIKSPDDVSSINDGIVPFVLTSKTVDRDSEVILPDGARLDNFNKNPVFLWAHDARGLPPIGKVIPDTLTKSEDKLTANIKFDLDDPFAKLVYEKYKKGFLNAGSIRFIPITWSDETVLPGQKGITIKEWELLEFSAVPIPANQEALVIKGYENDPRVKNWAEQVKEFMQNDNFDHTPEGWIDLLNTKDDEISFNNNFNQSQASSSVDFHQDEIKIIPWISKEGTLYEPSFTIDQIKEVVEEIVFIAVGKKTRPFRSFELIEDDISLEESVFSDDKDAYAYYDYETGKKMFSHHIVIDGKIKTSWLAVAQAMIELFKDETLPEKERLEIYDHLSKHYAEFNKRPPELREKYTQEEIEEIEEQPFLAIEMDEGLVISEESQSRLIELVTEGLKKKD